MEIDPEDEEASAMAAAMGFSSFGSHKLPAKKRKFNPATDAFVEGQALDELDRGGKKGTGSGGNNTPLGKARVFGKARAAEVHKKNHDEIDLDEEERVKENDVEKESGISQFEGSRHALLQEEVIDGPRYLDTSQPPPIENKGSREVGLSRSDIGSDGADWASGRDETEQEEMQTRIDAILASIESAPPPPGQETLPLRNIDDGPASHFHSKPAHDNVPFGQGRPQKSTERGYHGRRSQRDKLWYEDYYDPSFNENPWVEVEKAKGLVTEGTWIERHARPVNH